MKKWLGTRTLNGLFALNFGCFFTFILFYFIRFYLTWQIFSGPLTFRFTDFRDFSAHVSLSQQQKRNGRRSK